MKALNYRKLMNLIPTELGSITNQLGQAVTFVEHPLLGDEYPVIAVFHKFKVAGPTDFFDTEDMYPGSEYLPVFRDGRIGCAWEFDL